MTSALTWIIPASGLLATLVLTLALKSGVPAMRPDGSDTRSFPSGHASLSACAAVSLIPLLPHSPLTSLLLAAGPLLVGASRVVLRRHHARDVLAGWALGAAIAAMGLLWRAALALAYA
jgi:membrane-associated phospholipid phosphatase